MFRGLIFSLLPALALTALPGLNAQTLTNLYSFTDGQNPQGALVEGSDGNFYGTTGGGSATTNGPLVVTNGGIFMISPAGVFTNLVSFSGGATPQGALVQGNDGNFYGTTFSGGIFTNGSVFMMTPAGVVTNIVSFDGTNGAFPYAGPTKGINGNFYGTTTAGGYGSNTNNAGTVFEVTPSGILVDLILFGDFPAANGTAPYSALVQGSDGSFYGTTYSGGSNEDGTIFRVTPNELTTLASFNDAGEPSALVEGADGNFYGTTAYGGAVGYGSIFQITPNGELTTLVSFDLDNGANPFGALLLAYDGNFYGTTMNGGIGLLGTIFKMTPKGELTTLINFYGTNGAYPLAALVQGSDGNLYGTTAAGGSNGMGTVFNLSLAPVIQPLQVTTTLLPAGLIGKPYSETLTASGGQPPYIWSLNSNSLSLPPGLTLAGNGVISGEPEKTGTFSFTVQVANALPTTTNQTLSLLIYEPPDLQMPTVKITSPRNNEIDRSTNSGFQLIGTAHDDAGVTNVFYMLNGTNCIEASSTDYWANWTANVTLTPGINTIVAKAVDANANTADSSQIKLDFEFLVPLTVQTNGSGKVSPDYNAKTLQVGKTYEMKAVPTKGFEFANWACTGTNIITPTNKSRVRFIMGSNLTLTASFTNKP